MTGFAKKQCTIDSHKYTIEIKTLNSKTMDASVKIPARLHAHDLDIRTMLSRLERGKVDFLLTDENAATDSLHLNQPCAAARFAEVRSLADQLGLDPQALFQPLIMQPDLWTSHDDDEMTDEAWSTLAQTIGQAIDEVDRFRQEEGEILKADFIKHIDLIEHKLNQIPQYEAERIATARERIHKYFADAAVKDVDNNRFEQEMIYYLEKLDITEEKIRLQKHIDYFRTTMATEESCGKKLGFIAQEMGREINTTGSKANHVDIQKLVVEMKDELEKIKEQLGNIL